MEGTAQPAAADYELLRTRWAEMLVGRDVDPADPRFAAAIAALDTETEAGLALLDRRPDRDRVFTDQPLDPALPDRNPSSITRTYRRLGTMAVARSTPGSRYEGDSALLDDVVRGLRTVHDLVYNERQPEFGNWWEWEIGSTRALTDCLTLVYDAVETPDRDRYLAAIDHFVPDPFYMMQGDNRQLSTGANRVDLCRAIAVRGALGEDDAKISRSRDGLSDIFVYATSGDGFYVDGSFVQHGTVAYTGTYGIELLDGMSKLIALLVETPWTVDDPGREVLFRAVEITFAPMVYDGQMLDFVRGRANSRELRRDHTDGRSAAEHILKLAEGVAAEDPERAHRWREICKGWLTRDVFDGGPLTGARAPRVGAFAATLDDATIEPASEPDGFGLFASMDRVVHRRPGWAYAISLASKRISYYECGNGENNKGFHTGEGMTSLYLAHDNAQWADGFWPTVDYYRMPGTTIDTKPLPDAAGGTFGAARPERVTWVGGAGLGDVGAVGMDMEGILAPLTGRKAWFCFEDFVVALGAGISDVNGYAVETVVENRNLHADGENALVIDGEVQPSEPGWSTRRPAYWAHLEGVAGYLFPYGVELSARREERTGTWRDINPAGSTTPVTRRWLTMWLDHGVDPVDADYAYVVIPQATRARTAELADAASVLVNTPSLQAVRVGRDRGLLFWQPGQVDVVRAKSPCAMMLRERKGELTVAVGDPTQEQASLEVMLLRPDFTTWDADDTITVHSLHPVIRFTVATSATAGRTHTVTFRRADVGRG